ncbi:MAG: response regulator [Longimicrobiales bacterium]
MNDRRTPVRVAIADDHPVVRDGLAAMLATQADIHVAGLAGTGPEALDVVTATDPDVLLLDLEMPGLDGVSVLRRLRETGARTRVIIFTVFDTDERIIAAVEAGAAGYLLKGAPRAEVFDAVRQVAAGGSLLAPVATSAVLRRVRGGGTARPNTAITPREQTVLAHLARGRSNKQIAATLRISERTVKFHVSSIITKLGAANRTDAVTRAAQAGMITL